MNPFGFNLLEWVCRVEWWLALSRLAFSSPPPVLTQFICNGSKENLSHINNNSNLLTKLTRWKHCAVVHLHFQKTLSIHQVQSTNRSYICSGKLFKYILTNWNQSLHLYFNHFRTWTSELRGLIAECFRHILNIQIIHFSAYAYSACQYIHFLCKEIKWKWHHVWFIFWKIFYFQSKINDILPYKKV